MKSTRNITLALAVVAMLVLSGVALAKVPMLVFVSDQPPVPEATIQVSHDSYYRADAENQAAEDLDDPNAPPSVADAIL